MALLAALVISIGSPIAALVLGYSNPVWCSHAYVGCIPEMIALVACAFVLGLILSVIAFKNGRKPTLTWCVLAWNALGGMCFGVIALKVVFR